MIGDDLATIMSRETKMCCALSEITPVGTNMAPLIVARHIEAVPPRHLR